MTATSSCPSGEIGRHSGLKIRRFVNSGRAGSIPASGTKGNKKWAVVAPKLVALCCFVLGLRWGDFGLLHAALVSGIKVRQNALLTSIRKWLRYFHAQQ